jgi:hypothetical protein
MEEPPALDTPVLTSSRAGRINAIVEKIGWDVRIFAVIAVGIEIYKAFERGR